MSFSRSQREAPEKTQTPVTHSLLTEACPLLTGIVHPLILVAFILSSHKERERERSLRRALSLWIEEIGHVESITGALIHCFNAYSCANVDFCGYNATLMRRAVFIQTGYLHECLRGRGIVAGWCIV